MASTPKKNSKKQTNPRELVRFVEELSWLMKSFEGLDFNALSKLSFEMEQFNSQKEMFSSKKKDSTTYLLVGILPDFLMDSALFPTNENIVEFAGAALNMEIGRWQKKSKFEIIGQIVCHANLAPRPMIQNLSLIIEDMKDKRTHIRRSIELDIQEGRSWSEVIGSLYDGI